MKRFLIFLFAAFLFSAAQAQLPAAHRGHPAYKTNCGAVTDIFIDEISGTSATIHWSTNGSASYHVIVVNLDNPQQKIVLVTHLGSVALDNLNYCTAYKLIIVSECGGGMYKTRPIVFYTLGCK